MPVPPSVKTHGYEKTSPPEGAKGFVTVLYDFIRLLMNAESFLHRLAWCYQSPESHRLSNRQAHHSARKPSRFSRLTGTLLSRTDSSLRRPLPTPPPLQSAAVMERAKSRVLGGRPGVRFNARWPVPCANQCRLRTSALQARAHGC
jgi:hypothetical protein